jgi:outer membrane protein OmpA-like peptidoglycan-associated protein
VAAIGAVALSGCATRKAVSADIGRTEAKLDQRLAQLDQRLGQMETALKGQGERLARLEAATAEAATAASEAARRAEAAGAAAGEARGEAARAAQAAGEARTRAEAAGAAATGAASAAGAAQARAAAGVARATGTAAETMVDSATVRFAFDHWDLDDRAQSALADLLKRLEGQSAVVLTLEGHTDSIGTDGYNFELSRKRAEAVRRFIVDRGINLRRIEFIGFGETHPSTTNATPAGRAENRRVLIKLIAGE